MSDNTSGADTSGARTSGAGPSLVGTAPSRVDKGVFKVGRWIYVAPSSNASALSVYQRIRFLPPMGLLAAIGIAFAVAPDYVDRGRLQWWAVAGILLAALSLLDSLRPTFHETPRIDGLPFTVFLHTGASGVWIGALLWADLAAARENEWSYLVGMLVLGTALGQIHIGDLGYLGPTALTSSLMTTSAAQAVAGHWELAIGGVFLLAAGLYIADASTKVYRELVQLRAQSDMLAQANGWLAEHDPLTGLLNRRGLDGKLQDDEFVACLFIDLDHFKIINDNHGHDVGDQVLREVADRLRRIVPDKGLVARLGGDEFVIVLDDRSDADQLGTNVLTAIRAPIVTGDDRIVISASAGAVPILGPTSLRDLLRQSDIALYQAKEGGRDRLSWRPELTTDL